MVMTRDVICIEVIIPEDEVLYLDRLINYILGEVKAMDFFLILLIILGILMSILGFIMRDEYINSKIDRLRGEKDDNDESETSNN